MENKKCNTCGETRNLIYFKIKKYTTKDGTIKSCFRSKCKLCMSKESGYKTQRIPFTYNKYGQIQCNTCKEFKEPQAFTNTTTQEGVTYYKNKKCKSCEGVKKYKLPEYKITEEVIRFLDKIKRKRYIDMVDVYTLTHHFINTFYYIDYGDNFDIKDEIVIMWNKLNKLKYDNERS